MKQTRWRLRFGAIVLTNLSTPRWSYPPLAGWLRTGTTVNWTPLSRFCGLVIDHAATLVPAARNGETRYLTKPSRESSWSLPLSVIKKNPGTRAYLFLEAQPELLLNGAKTASACIALAHGAGMASPFMGYFATALAEGGFRVARISVSGEPKQNRQEATTR